ncbi:hypothetical protein EYZ11_003565 [Aspergillus tanneri]|uniref:Uncharacterized protein n=1 Tax=Aspergillus tanneri TaxID=1220188 RepID=A0A4S3JQ33_9EURO|nr:hypothetical protein EYZ11_003565 [Aspergillus tanneri]
MFTFIRCALTPARDCQLVWKSIELHEKYGSVDAHAILSADKSNHARLRRILAPALSEKAIRENDGIVLKYVNLLVDRLRARCGQSFLDLNKYFECTTLDLIADLICGQPDGCLRKEDGGVWLDILRNVIQSQVWMQALETYGLARWSSYLLPKARANATIENGKIIGAKIQTRMTNQPHHRDMMSYILSEKNAMSPLEMRLNAATIIGAGTGTTATWLSTTFHSLTMNRDAYQCLAKEVRSAFASDVDITSDRVAQLPYLNAVLQESLRIHSPSPSATGRFVPSGGEVIDGRFVPEGTTVGVHQHAAYHCRSNFHRSNEFCPERWLPQARESKSPFAKDQLGVVNPFSYGPRTCLGIR